jgi:hypothetical protein
MEVVVMMIERLIEDMVDMDGVRTLIEECGRR